VAACTSGPSGPAGSTIVPAIDSCSLLTTDQAAAAMGGPARPGRPLSGADGCDWAAEHGSPYVEVEVLSEAEFRGAGRHLPAGMSTSSVRGVGDEAFTVNGEASDHVLYVGVRDRYVRVLVAYGEGSVKDLDAEKQLFGVIRPRL
jgi:hypothetical protein